MGSKTANIFGVKWFSWRVLGYVLLHPLLMTSTFIDLQMEIDSLRQKLVSWMNGSNG